MADNLKGTDHYKAKGLESIISFVTPEVKKSLRVRMAENGFKSLTKYTSTVLSLKAGAGKCIN
jgi:hypothetical protein